MNTTLWLGSQTSYDATLKAAQLVQANYGSATDTPVANLLEVQDNVGIVNISGSLVDGYAGYMSYFGVTGYADIREALVAAIKHPNVTAILLNIGSGGGAVAGCHETAGLIARVSEIKPVVSYTGSTEASAALWVGSSAKYSFVAETAIVGSLGIMMVHADRTKQLEMDGVKATVIRAGSEKALNTPYEVLTEQAKAKLQAQADTMYDIFLGHVATQRGLSNTVADNRFGQGREFIGKEAVAASLMDAVGTLEDAFAKASALGNKTSKKPTKSKMVAETTTPVISDNVSGVSASAVEGGDSAGYNSTITQGLNMPKILSPEHLAAMAAGVDLEDAEQTATAGAKAAPTATDLTTESATAESVPSEAMALLQTQLKDAQDALVTAKVAEKLATDTLAANNTSLEAFAAIARNSVKTMTVALGGKAESVEALATPDLLAEHTRVSEVFKTKFKVGGVAATTSEGAAKAKATVSPFFAVLTKSHA